MASYRDITNELVTPFTGRPEAQYLAHALGSFASIRLQEVPHEVRMHASGHPWIRVRFRPRTHCVKSVEIESSDSTEIGQYVDGVREQLAGAAEAIYPFTAFTARPVCGTFVSASNQLCIQQAHRDHPRPAFEMGEHPCTLYTTYARFPNSEEISRVAREQRARQCTLLLNAFTHGMRLRDPYGQHDYAIVVRGGSPICEYVQLDYWAWHVVPDSMPTCGFGEAIPEVGEQTYFSPSLQAAALWPYTEFSIPDTLNDLFAMFTSSSDELQTRFLRACHWLHMSADVSAGNDDLRMVCLATGIEALLPEPASGTCSLCKKPSGPGPTRLFRDFVNEYMHELATDKRFASLVYDLRSKIVHGSYIVGDGVPWLMPFGGQYNSDDQLIRSFYRGLRLAMVRWLRSEAANESQSS